MAGVNGGGLAVHPHSAADCSSIAYIVVLVALRPLNEDEMALVKRSLPGRIARYV